MLSRFLAQSSNFCRDDSPDLEVKLVTALVLGIGWDG